MTSTKRRITATLSITAFIALIGFLLPTHYRVTQQALVLAVNGESVSPTVPGTVKTVAVHTGDWVEPGQLIATLENPTVTVEVEARRAEVAQVRLRMAQSMQSSGLDATELGPELSKMVDVAEAAYARALEDQANLEIRAKVAGYVVSPMVQNLVGTYLVPQQALLRIADTREVKLVIPLTEDQAQLVEQGDRVEGRWVSTGDKFETVLATVPTHQAGAHDFAPGLLSMFGGPAPIDAARRNGSGGVGGSAKAFPLFMAEARIAPQSGPVFMLEGMRARVEITGRPTTPARKLWRWLVSLWIK